MCGIFGGVSVNPIKSCEVERAIKLGRQLKKRGDDDFNFYLSPSHTLLFLHQALKIMDRSKDSSQPFFFNEYAMVYNGEIYNYREIRKELSEEGHIFITDSDTEVVIKAISNWGIDVALEKFNGEFAIVLWNDKLQQLSLIRDRFGIRPLYYYVNEEDIWFCSDLKILARYIGKKDVNNCAILSCFATQTIMPVDQCFLDKYRKVKPGTYLQFLKKGSIFIERRVCYYNLYERVTEIGKEDLIEVTYSKLKAAVEKRMLGHSKIGLWLSGGLDSSLLQAICIKEFDKPIFSFSLRSPSSKKEKGNEFTYSAYVNSLYSSGSCERIILTEDDIIDEINESISSSYEPMFSNDYIGHYILGKYTKKAGIKFTLTGVGADEIWLGYNWHEKLIEGSYSSSKEFKNVFLDRSILNIKDIVNEEIWKDDRFKVEYEEWFEKKSYGQWDYLNHSINNVLPEDLLKRADIAGLSNAVEVRVPFLDHDLVEFAMGISVHERMKDNITKYLLKKVAEKYFAKEFIYREKGYFSVPLVKYTEGKIGDYCKETINSKKCRKRGIVKEKYIDSLLHSKEQTLSSMETNSLWQIFVMEKWFENLEKEIML